MVAWFDLELPLIDPFVSKLLDSLIKTSTSVAGAHTHINAHESCRMRFGFSSFLSNGKHAFLLVCWRSSLLASMLEAIPSRLEAITSRLEAILLGWRPSLLASHMPCISSFGLSCAACSAMPTAFHHAFRGSLRRWWGLWRESTTLRLVLKLMHATFTIIRVACEISRGHSSL